jgi:hypothetical protein
MNVSEELMFKTMRVVSSDYLASSEMNTNVPSGCIKHKGSLHSLSDC